MQTFVISPSDGFAGVLDETEGTVRLVLPSSQQGRMVRALNYFSRFPSSAVLQVSNDAEGIQQFDTLRAHRLALDFTLLLLDAEISNETRSEVAQELDELLENSGSRDYVLDVLLAAPLPVDADVACAVEAARRWSHSRSLINTLVDCQPRVRLANSAWLSIRENQFVKHAGIDRVHGLLIDFGVFRTLVLHGKTQQDRQRMIPKVIIGLKEHCNPQITTELLNEYFSKLPVGLRVAQEAPSSIEDDPLEDARLITTGKSRTPYYGSDVKLARAESQVERIAELFSQHQDQQAHQILKELVESQTRDSENHSHVVKSLCNIATKCEISGRRDINLYCLSKAQSFTTGVDAVLYAQIGTALRSIRKFDEALVCYEKALDLEHGEYRKSIQLDIIRVSIDKGDYENALKQLLEGVAGEAYRPAWLVNIGTLYRKMGNLRKARDYYGQALKNDDRIHTARAGIAETDKQSGKHSKAIARYQKLFRDFPDLDDGASKIYNLAQSFLFRVTHQSQKASEILQQLNLRYPIDPGVHLQLAKLYMLEGKTDLARKHFDRAQGPDLDEIAAKLFLIADGKLVALPDPEATIADCWILPEEKGLLRCSRAMIALEQDNFEKAVQMVSRPVYGDRLSSDFGAALRFHAQKKLDPKFDYKSDQVLCRIAKRGYRELRQSVVAVANDEFLAAKRLEQRMCLLLA